MQDKSVFGNIFLFWELSTSSMAKKEDLPILLLDFEKAYDRVNWDFLEEAIRVSKSLDYSSGSFV